MKKSLIVIALLVFGFFQVSDAQRTEQRVRTEARQGLDNGNTKHQNVRKGKNGRKKAWRKKHMNKKRSGLHQGQKVKNKQNLQGRKKNMMRRNAQINQRDRNQAPPQSRKNNKRVF